jgi:predicted HicB family RNase H-like nuclease
MRQPRFDCRAATSTRAGAHAKEQKVLIIKQHSSSSRQSVLADSSFKGSKGKKTVTRSFRINEASFLALEEDAQRHNVSLNTLVDQLFDAHSNYERFIEKMGMMRMAKLTFRRILDVSSPEGVAHAAKLHAKDQGKVAAISKYGELNVPNILDGLLVMFTYGGWGEYHETRSSRGKRVITLIHDLGQNGSVYLLNFVKSIFEDIDVEPKITPTEQGIVIEV